jgi:hypothetical protein
MTRVAMPLPRAASVRVSSDLAHVALIGVALGVWAFALRGAHLDRMSGLGLLNALPHTYALAFAMLLIGFMIAVSRPVLRPRVLWLYVIALILVLHATAPLLYDEPRYAWTYKHLGVINSIVAQGSVNRSLDIYANWPGFFALNAWLSAATGVQPIVWAGWAQVAFNLLWVGAGRFALRGATSDQRVLWSATWLFLLGNWLGQDYLAPQALGMVMALIIVGLALRVARVRADAPVAPGRPALIVGTLCWIAVLVSHQLTPVLLILALGALSITTRRLPLWVPIAMGVTEICWLVYAWPFLGQTISLFDSDPTKNARPSGYVPGHGLPGLQVVGMAARASVGIFGALAIAGFVHRLRAGRTEWALTALVAGPVLTMGMQAYGGEGPFRIYLFALPWLALLGATAVVPRPAAMRLRNRVPWRLAIASVAAGAALLPAYFGLDLMNRITPDDVKAATWFDRNTPDGSVLTYVVPNFPNRLTAQYGRHLVPASSFAPNLADEPAFREHKLGRADTPNIAAFMSHLPSRNAYIVLSPSQADAGRLYGGLPAGSMQSLDRALAADPAFQLVYRHGRASIYKLRRTRASG